MIRLGSLIALAGCRQIFGISDPQAATEDAGLTIDVQHAIDGPIDDATTSSEVAHFALDVIAGNKTPDDIGHHDATCTDATRPSVVTGHRANALQFVSPDYVVIPPVAATNAQALTIALWFDLLAPPGVGADCLLYQPQTLSLCVGSSGQVTFATTNNGLGDSLTASRLLAINTWYHLAVVYDGQGKRIYIDGVIDSADTANVTPTGNTIAVGAALGGGNDQPGSYANATLDELVIYARALSADEIQGLAHQ